MHRPIDLREKLSRFAEPWSPRIVAELNDYQLKLVKARGDFVRHAHADTDEAFLVLAGRLTIELPDGAVELGAGQLFVVPRGVEHRPRADGECHLLLIEPRGVVNTGDAGGGPTAPTDVWV